jgi:hypothetical protein
VITGIFITLLLHINILSRIFILSISFLEQDDTISVNKTNKNLFANARRNPDLVIPMARHILLESEKMNYQRGMADASLTLGLAWYTKYFNRDDSAEYYIMKAYDIYRNLDNSAGKARACFYLSYVYSIKGDLTEAERYAALSLNFFQEAGDNRGIINSYHNLAFLAQRQTEFKKAIALIKQAVDIARSTNDTLPLADVTNSMGNIYKDMALFNQAIDAYFEALRLWEIKGDSNGIAIANGSIGLMYYYQQDWIMALQYCFKTASIMKARNNIWELSKIYNTIASIYNAKNKNDSALIFQRKSLQLNHKMNYQQMIASSYNDIASTHLLLSQADSAHWYIIKALEIADKITDPEHVTYYITFGNILKSQGQTLQAQENLTKAYNMARKQKLPMVIQDVSLVLSDLYSSMNRKDLAYKYLKEHYQIKDSISNAAYLKQVTRMELQYDYDKKQKAADYERKKESIRHENQIRQQRRALAGLGILILLVALISFLTLRHISLRNRLTRIDLEQRLLRAQMNPHFIFNSLCAVQDFILAGKSQKANTFLTKIARLMRNILENSREEYIPLKKEIETVKLYLDLQQLRFENEFDYNIHLGEGLDPENISIPPMLTQPCVENSIEHGLIPMKEKGNIKISYSLSDGLMKLEVTDNGIGRKEAEVRTSVKKNKKSLSTQVTRERLENFRKTMRQKNISYEITDLYNNKQAAGTRVVMMLPYRKIYA